MQRHTLDPKLDVVFRRLFSDRRNRDLLCDLLTAVLRPPSPITGVEVLNPVLPGESVTGRGTVLDLLVRLLGGRLVHVEMQARRQTGFLSRGLFYWARAYTSQLTAGQSYAELAPTVGIFILDYVELPSERYHGIYKVQSTHDGSPLSDDLELHFLELPKVPWKTPEGPEADPVVKWARFLIAQTDEQLEHLAMTDPLLQQAKQALELLSGDPIAREEAIKRAYDLGDYESRLNRLRQEAAEAIEKGRQEGRQEGRQDGERAVLRRLLVRKFGELPPEAEARLANATEEQLGCWAERMLTVATLDDVFL